VAPGASVLQELATLDSLGMAAGGDFHRPLRFGAQNMDMA
jgi:hypothetical protein